jgi:hypothetical protein
MSFTTSPFVKKLSLYIMTYFLQIGKSFWVKEVIILYFNLGSINRIPGIRLID